MLYIGAKLFLDRLVKPKVKRYGLKLGGRAPHNRRTGAPVRRKGTLNGSFSSVKTLGQGDARADGHGAFGSAATVTAFCFSQP